jgi:hypothetical protein
MALRKAHGVKNGGTAGQGGYLSHDGKGNWETILKAESGLSQSTAYRFEDMAKAAAPRITKHPALKNFIPGEHSLASLPAPQKAALETVVKKLTDGVTQKEFGEMVGAWKSTGNPRGRRPGEGGRPPEAIDDSDDADPLSDLRQEILLVIDQDAEVFERAAPEVFRAFKPLLTALNDRYAAVEKRRRK